MKSASVMVNLQEVLFVSLEVRVRVTIRWGETTKILMHLKLVFTFTARVDNGDM